MKHDIVKWGGLTPHYDGAGVTVFHGDCLHILRGLPDESVHAVVTDPPYGLSNTDPGHVSEAITHWTTGDRTFLPSAGGGFMGKAWDEFVPPPAVWDECMRVLKPGGHLLAFAGSRTVDLMALSIRLAGFDIRDSIAWLYGSGFPKSLDVAQAIDKLDATTERRERALQFTAWMRAAGLTSTQINEATASNMGGHYLTEAEQPAIATADMFDLLRPLLPPVPDYIEQLVTDRTVESKNHAAREVIGEYSKTAAANAWRGRYDESASIKTDAGKITRPHTEEAMAWEGWGTALKPAFEPIVVARKPLAGTVAVNVLAHGTGALNIDANRVHSADSAGQAYTVKRLKPGATLNREGGSWRADGMDAETFEGQTKDGRWPANVVLEESQADELDRQAPDTGGSGRASGPSLTGATGASAAYGARNGTDSTPFYGGEKGGASRMFPTFRYEAKAPTSERPVVDGVAHPTVKPLDLMRWLVRLVTPKGGTVLEPFAGSGTTVEACIREGFNVIAIEREADYLPLIEKRIRKDHAQGLDFDWGDAS